MEASSSNSSVQQLYSKLDIFGIGYNFTINGKDIYKTNTGASLTIFLFVTMIALFMGFGVDLYERKHPNVSSNTLMGQYKRQVLGNNNFTFAYRVEDDSGQLNIDPTVHNFEIWYTAGVMDKTSGIWVSIFNKVLEPKWCKDIEGIQENEKKFNFSLKEWHCIDFMNNFTMGGNWDGDFYYLWQINTVQCMNSTANNNTCKSQEEIYNAFVNNRTSGNLFFSYLYMDAVIAMDNFDSPLSNYLINRYKMLNLQVTKSEVQLFKNIQMENDIGWLFPDIKFIDIYASDTITSDFVLKDEWKQNIVFTYFAYLGKKYDTYNRSYTKIQTVLAAVGGFAKFFYISIFMFYYYFSKTHRNLNLIDILNQEHEFNYTPNPRVPQSYNVSNTFPNKFETFFQNNIKPKQQEQETYRFFTTISQSKNDLSKSKNQTKLDFQMLRLNYNLKNKIITNQKENKINVSFFGLFCFKFLKCCLSKNKKSHLKIQSELYNEEKNLIYKLFDSLNFIKFQKEFHTLKKVLLNEFQQCLLSVVSTNNSEMQSTPTYKERVTKLLGMLSEPDMENIINSDPISRKLLQKLDTTQKDSINKEI